ncbi:MAG: restriction endonuclease [Methanotrichaceae archaeon]
MTMNPQQAGYKFEEELAELIELNGYDVIKTGKSNDGGVDIIATKIDEVGQKVTYIIQCKKQSNPVDRTVVDSILGAQKRYQGSIAVVASAYSGFTRGAQEVAEKFGVRLWGESEIENLKRNVTRKRNLTHRRSINEKNVEHADARKSSRKFVGYFIILAIILACAYFFGTEQIHNYVMNLEDQIDLQNIYETNIQNVYETVRNELKLIYNYVMNLEGQIDLQNIYETNIQNVYETVRDELERLMSIVW